MSERFEWVEIVEPRTREKMYANLATGECVWQPPEGVNIKRTDSSQWWELFDTNTQRFYYYNVSSQTTVWHRPNNCDIIPLAKLQILKQNTDPSDKKDGVTQTSYSNVRGQTNNLRTKSGHPKFRSTEQSASRNLLDHISLSHQQSCYRLPSSETISSEKSQQDMARIQLTRSGSFMSSTSCHTSLSPSVYIPMNFKGNIEIAGGISDDSMHEKYFKSIQNSPLSPRRRTNSMKAITKKQSTGSNAQSSISTQIHSNKTVRPSVSTNLPAVESLNKRYNIISSPKNDCRLKLDLTSKSNEQKIEKRLIKESGKIPVVQSSNSPNSIPMKFVLGKNTAEATSSHFPDDSEPIFSSIPFVDPHPIEKSSRRPKKKQDTAYSDVEYDNGNMSPLYSNWDQEMQQHLLPLQYYIIEQAKISGCCTFGDALDSDSFHSDSQSEQSFSGHEPDNEDSDHSDGPGNFLIHNSELMNDYTPAEGESYYNFNYPARDDPYDGSESLESILENEKGTENRSFSEFKVSSSFQPAQIQSKSQMHPLYHQSSLPDYNEYTEQTRKEILLENQNPKPNFQIQHHTTKLYRGGEHSSLTIIKDCDIEKFAQDNLKIHSKGIFRKKVSIRDMLSWTPTAINRPMLALARDKSEKKMAIEIFKLVQMYMGDRKAKAGMTLNSVAMDVINMGLSQQHLRDELYVQLCRQTTENPKRESLIRGWELMAICLSFVPPSPTFQPALLNYMNRHRDPTFAACFPDIGKWPIHVQISHYATVCCRRLKRLEYPTKKHICKPTEAEIEQARGQILRDSMFGNTLGEVMDLQKEKFPDRKLPWIQVTLSEQVLLFSGKQTEGIFRVSADIDEVNILKSRLDRWDVPEYKNTMDAHAPASLLKLWYRELFYPLIPDELYDECVQTEDPIKAEAIISKLPEINKLVLMYLVHFLQQFTDPEVVSCTKMDSSNLAMVFAPNCLRCTSDDPKVILENARKEMAFMRTLIQHMDTSGVANLI